MRVQRQAEMAEQQAAEQHARHSQLDAPDLDAAEQQPQDRRQGNHQNGLRMRRDILDAVEKFDHPADHAHSPLAGNA